MPFCALGPETGVGLKPPGDAMQSRRLVAKMQATEERSREGSA